MTRKDYEAIATILRKNRNALELMKERTNFKTGSAFALLSSIQDDLSNLFESDNPRFDREKFIAKATATESHKKAVLEALNA